LMKKRTSVSKIIEILSKSPAKSQPSRAVHRIERIVEELLMKEATYIETLSKGIERYVSIINSNLSSDVPDELRDQKFSLFGNIEEILGLHKTALYPRLIACNGNVKKIAEVFIEMVKNDDFYCYITYGVNQRAADQLLGFHVSYFNRIRDLHHDTLGVHSFVIQPIQRLPRYKMLLLEMIKEMGHELTHCNKEAIAACCIAEKSMSRLLVRLNEALSINDIIETRELPYNLQSGLISVVQREYGADMNEPTLLLMPRFSSHHGYRSAVSCCFSSWA